jgi:hypothetical protein
MKRIDLNKPLIICGTKYKIIKTKYLRDVAETLDKIGSISYHRKEIILYDNIHKDELYCIFLHEVIHGIFHETGIADLIGDEEKLVEIYSRYISRKPLSWFSSLGNLQSDPVFKNVGFVHETYNIMFLTLFAKAIKDIIEHNCLK